MYKILFEISLSHRLSNDTATVQQQNAHFLLVLATMSKKGIFSLTNGFKFGLSDVQSSAVLKPGIFCF